MINNYKNILNMEKEKVYNTYSKRYLQVGGNRYKKLLNEGYTHVNDQLVPPSKVIKSTKSYKGVRKSPQNSTMSREYFNKDTVYTLLLNLDMNGLKNTCLINKSTMMTCSQKQFWIEKFKHDELPFIINETKVKKLSNVNDWIKEYIKIKDAYQVSNKLVNYMINKKKNYFDIINILTEEIDIDKINWLTPKINEAILKSSNDADRSLFFDINGFTINYMYTVIDKETGDYDEEYTEFIDKVSQKEFIIYLTKIFYYFPKVAIMNEVDYDKDEIDIYLFYKDFLNNPKQVKSLLPDW